MNDFLPVSGGLPRGGPGRVVGAFPKCDPSWPREAFLYELARRTYRERLPPYSTLDDLQRTRVMVAFASEAKVPFLAAVESNPPLDDGVHTGLCPLQFPLNRSDNEIAVAFADWLAGERRRLGIASPQARKGGRKRPIPWEWLQVLDKRATDGHEPLSDAERSKCSVAQRESCRLHPCLDRIASLLIAERIKRR